jgi:predicted amidohydrolase YtcJ
MKRLSLSASGLVVFLWLSGLTNGVAIGAAKEHVKNNKRADLILHNGVIAIMDEQASFVDAVAIRDGKILAVGDNEHIRSLAKDGAQIIDLQGRTVVPGLIDGHLHGLRNAYHCFTQAVRLDNVFSRAQALEMYRVKGEQLSGDTWIFTTAGWTVRQLDQPGMFTLAELDAVLPATPVLVFGNSFSGVQVNSHAMQILGLDAGSPGVVLDENGNPTGQLIDEAQSIAGSAVAAQLDTHSIDEQAACLEDFIRAANSLGLTAWNDPEGNQAPFITGLAGSCHEFAQGMHDHQAVIHLRREDRLNARITFHLMNNFSGLNQVLSDHRHTLGFMGDDVLRYLGVGEEVLCPGNQPPPDPKEYQAIVNFLAANRMSFEHHASADQTQRAELDAWEVANTIYPLARLHWTVAHPGEDGISPTDETLERVRALGVGMTPITSGALTSAQGRTPRFRSMLNSGIHLCLSTDAMNVAPYPPFITLWYVVSGNTLDPDVPGVPPEQRLTRMEALRAKTVSCAWNLTQEGRLGSLEIGRHADLIVLSDDYFSVPTDDIRSITSVLTIVGGRIVYDAGRLRRTPHEDG